MVGDTAYVGDWSGRFYALDTSTGQPRWTFQADDRPAGLRRANRVERRGRGRRRRRDGRDLRQRAHAVRARRADAGEALVLPGRRGRRRRLHRDRVVAGRSPTARCSSASTCTTSPANGPASSRSTRRHGRRGLALRPEQGGAPKGCGDVWSSPSVDLDRGLVFVGTAATARRRPRAGADYTEAHHRRRPRRRAAALVRTSRTGPTTTTSTSPARPNLFRAATATSSAWATRTAPTTRSTATPASWCGRRRRPAPASTRAGIELLDRRVHRSDRVQRRHRRRRHGGRARRPTCTPSTRATGDILWQSTGRAGDLRRRRPSSTACCSTAATTSRCAPSTWRTGDVLWQHEMKGVVAGGPAVVGDDVYAVAGIREPGLEGRSENSGVYRFSLPEARARPAAPTLSVDRPPRPAPRATDLVLEPTHPDLRRQRRATCSRTGITLRPPPAGLQPTATLEIDHRPVPGHGPRHRSRHADQWLQDGSPARRRRRHGVRPVHLRERRQPDRRRAVHPRRRPTACTTDSLPRLTTYNRISLLALEGPDSRPDAAPTARPRLIVTTSFDPPLTPVGAN